MTPRPTSEILRAIEQAKVIAEFQKDDVGVFPKYLPVLIDGIEQLRKENDELKKDKERLDWLAKQPKLTALGHNPSGLWSIFSKDNSGISATIEHGVGTSVRAALDSAMKKGEYDPMQILR